MAIDTVCLRSPVLDGEKCGAVRKKLDTLQRTSSDGEVQWQLQTKALTSSSQSKVILKLQDRPEGTSLRVEGSVHKLLLGQNVLGNPEGFASRCSEFIEFVQRTIEIELPAAAAWSVLRVDWAFVFDLGSPERVRAFFRGMQGAVFPRRKISKYDLQSIHIPGKTTTLKAYHKGPEFRANGADLRKSMHAGCIRMIQEHADRRLRVEVGIKLRRLMRLSRRGRGVPPQVQDIDDSKLEAIYEAEVDRLLREQRNQVEIVREHAAVHARLRSAYSDTLADTLYGFWGLMVNQGEGLVREMVKRSTFFRRRKQLVDQGVAWKGASVLDQPTSADVFDCLTLRRDDRHRCTESVEEALSTMEAASAVRAESAAAAVA